MATYRFTLSGLNSSLTFGADKVRNWKDIKPSFTKNETYRGVFRDYTNTFEFTDNVRRSVIKDFDEYGYDCELYLTIEVGNDNGEFSSFRQESYRLKAEIQDIEIDDLAVSLNFVDSGFVSKIMGRDDMDINMEVSDTGILESVDGTAFGAVDRLLWKTWLHDRKLIFNSLLEQSEEIGNISKVAQAQTFINYIIPMNIKYSSDDNIQSTYPEDAPYVSGDDFPNSFYLNSNKSRELEINLKTTIQYATNSDDYPIKWSPYIVIQSADNESINSIEISDWASESNGGPNPDMTGTLSEGYIEYNGTIEVLEGESVVFKLLGQLYGGIAGFPFNYTVEVKNLEMTIESLELFPATYADTIPPHELFTQLLQTITGQQNPFYSEFFGRPDLGYDNYGEGSGVCAATGKMIRGFPYGVSFIDKEEVSTFLNTSFQDAFNAYNKIFNLAATIEIIGNERRLRIEPIDYFRNFEVVAKLGNNISEISRTVNTKKIYSNIQVGYTDKEYEELNGLFSFNGESGFATPLEIEAEELNLVNTWRADGIGIELARRQQYEDNPSKDYRSDNDIFFIDCSFRNGFANGTIGRALLSIRDQNYESVTGIFEPASAYNLRLSPKKCLLNWGSEIKAGLSFKPDKYLKFIKGPSSAGLSTKKEGEEEVKENTDILISDLKNAKFIPEIITIAEAPISESDWQNIKDNRYGVIEFEHKGVTLYGFIQLAEFDVNRKTVNFELERANL